MISVESVQTIYSLQFGTFVKIKYTKLFTPESSIYQSLYQKNSLSSHRCHFVKKHNFRNKLLHVLC